MKTYKTHITKHFLLALLLFAGISVTNAQDPNAALYQQAIQTSMYPPGDTPDTSLIAITPNNPKLQWKTICGENYVLMLTWKTNTYYPKSGAYNTASYSPIWVTAAPELKERMKNETYTDANMRLKQLLGLPPNANYYYFYEIWVHPDDLFRPCPDKEITDGRCNICFTKADSADTDHIKWINETRLSRYYACGLYNQYPWTELGYTFDWNPENKSHIGLCEYVIRKHSRVYINKLYTTEEYLKK